MIVRARLVITVTVSTIVSLNWQHAGYAGAIVSAPWQFCNAVSTIGQGAASWHAGMPRAPPRTCGGLEPRVRDDRNPLMTPYLPAPPANPPGHA